MDVPEDLVPILKKPNRKLSPKTKDEAEAKHRLWPVIIEWQREFEDLRSRCNLVAADREHGVWDYYSSFLDRDEAEPANLPGKAGVETINAELLDKAERGVIKGTDPLAILYATLELQVAQKARDLSAGARKVKLDELRKHLARGETALIAHEVDQFLRQNRPFVDRQTPEWVSLAR